MDEFWLKLAILWIGGALLMIAELALAVRFAAVPLVHALSRLRESRGHTS